MFGSMLGFSGSAERIALFPVLDGGAVARNPCDSWAFLSFLSCRYFHSRIFSAPPGFKQVHFSAPGISIFRVCQQWRNETRTRGNAVPHFPQKGRVPQYFTEIYVKKKAHSFICLLTETSIFLYLFVILFCNSFCSWENYKFAFCNNFQCIIIILFYFYTLPF